MAVSYFPYSLSSGPWNLSLRYKTVNDGASKGTAGLKERATHFALIETSLKVCRPQSLTPKPQTRGPRPETRDPKPET